MVTFPTAELPASGFSKRFKPINRHTLTREAMIESLSDNFYKNEQGVLVSNGLSTDLIVFPSDLLPQYQTRLTKKIQSAMHYATAYKDVDELNCLYYIQPLSVSPSPEKKHKGLAKNMVMPIALYLYFADECSRLKTDKTFLTALRESGATLKPKATYDKNALLIRALEALDILGMDGDHKNVMRQWAQTGSFMIGGKWQSYDEKGALHGAYVKLASIICKQQQYVGMNLPISYALGNKSHVENLTAEEALKATNELVNKNPNTAIAQQIMERIDKGDEIREAHIRRLIHERVMPPKEEPILKADAMRDAFGILSYLPDAALEILCQRGYTLAYDDDNNIHTSFPKEPWPGIDIKYEDSNRITGYRQGRYSTIFLSNGFHVQPEALHQDKTLRYKKAAQTLAHEVMHIALDNTGPKELEWMKQTTERLAQDLGTLPTPYPGYLTRYLDTINTNTLLQILSLRNESYNGYVDSKHDDRWKEVICNIYGIMQTDFPYPPTVTPNPYDALPTLRALAEQINTSVEHARIKGHKHYMHGQDATMAI